jgi:hypothetical protein
VDWRIAVYALLSVLAHGVSGRPLSAWMQRQELTSDGDTERAAIRARSPHATTLPENAGDV